MKKAITVIVFLILLMSFASVLLSLYGLTVSRYEITSPRLSGRVRIVQLTDLHNSVFGTQNKRLVKKAAAQEPDLILITGDLLNQNEERTDIAEELISELAPVAPVYVSYGNHEALYEKNYGIDLGEIYSAVGAKVLDHDWADLNVNGQSIRLGGIYGYCLPEKYTETVEARDGETAFLKAFLDTDAYKILMCHMPYCWLEKESLDDWDADCVLCGHVHGGQMRFPGIGGLWAPDQGWFPGIVSGLYPSEDGNRVMVLSRGLGNKDKLPRFNNIPELVVLDLVPG